MSLAAKNLEKTKKIKWPKPPKWRIRVFARWMCDSKLWSDWGIKWAGMTCPAARSQQSSCHASLWSRCGCRALRSVVPKVNWILPWTSASKRHLRLGKATYGHERFMITLQQLQNISHDPISGAQVRDLSSVNYTLAVERKELLSTCIMMRLLQVCAWGVNYAYEYFSDPRKFSTASV